MEKNKRKEMAEEPEYEDLNEVESGDDGDEGEDLEEVSDSDEEQQQGKGKGQGQGMKNPNSVSAIENVSVTRRIPLANQVWKAKAKMKLLGKLSLNFFHFCIFFRWTYRVIPKQ